MVNVKNVSRMVDELALMRMFPSRDENARVGMVRLVCEMATEDAQARWLITRMLNLYAEWPGAREMRACFCSKFRPADGVSAFSTVYLDGIPGEKQPLAQLGAAETKLLPPGQTAISDDRGMAAAVHIAAKTIELKNRRISGPATEAEINAAPEWLRRLEGYE